MKENTTSNSLMHHTGQIVTSAYYDFQNIRKASMNRIRNIIRRKAEGISLDSPEKKNEDKTFDKKYADKKLPKRLFEIKHLLTENEYKYLKRTLEVTKEIARMEDTYKRMMSTFVKNEPVYQHFLQHIIGIGPVLSANLIKEFGHCEKYEHSSNLWSHCGMDVENGKAPYRKKGEKSKYSPRLKTLCWKIAESFKKKNSPVYRDIYEEEKEYQIQRMEHSVCRFCGKKTCEHYRKPKTMEYYCTRDIKQRVHLTDFDIVDLDVSNNATPPWSRKHAENRALRKAVKIFLEHYWVSSREVTGQSTESPWIIEHGKHGDYIDWHEVVEKNIQRRKQRKNRK